MARAVHLVLDGDEDNAVDGDRSQRFGAWLTFPTPVEEGAPWKVQVSTEIPRTCRVGFIRRQVNPCH